MRIKIFGERQYLPSGRSFRELTDTGYIFFGISIFAIACGLSFIAGYVSKLLP